MEFSEIKPFIRYAEKIKGADCVADSPLVCYDHVMIYTLDGECDITVDDLSYESSRGCVMIIKPGVVYRYNKLSDSYSAIMIHFDYDSKYSVERGFYIPPTSPENFKSSKTIDTEISPEQCFNKTLHIGKCYNLEESFKSIISEFKKRDRYFDFKLSASFTILLIEISRQIYSLDSDTNITGESIINDIISYIHENYNKDITNASISQKFNFHSKYINILIKNKTGYSLHKYILLRRVTKAIDYLQNTDMHIYEIAEKVGFSDPCHFTKCFKQLVGENPRNYRKS
ncbi:MAG: helix-turn-helix transcriptional regulator [Clostridia bacterium]|nr:helix-turn-helix transcriptional regulator [Clostridia bacterium]